MLAYTFSAEGFEHTDKLQKYVEGKVKDLEKYVPRKARDNASLAIRITHATKSRVESYTCHLELNVPGEKLVVTEDVEHSYASLDVTMAELRRQLAEYKSKHGKQSLRHRAAHRIRHAFTPKTDEE